MKKILLENFKTSLSKLNTNSKSITSEKLIKYVKNPVKIFPRIIWEFKKHFKEMDWEKRSEEMGNSSVFGNQISVAEQEKITNIHQNILYKILEGNLEKGSKVIDFGCGYGRFSDFFVNKFNCDYTGIESTQFFLNKLENKKDKKFLSFDYLKNDMELNDYFDLLFVFAVFGGFKKRKASDIFEILEKKVKPNGKIFVIEAISQKDTEDEWSFRTENYYRELFKNFDVSTKFYFLEDEKFNQIFYGKKN